MSAVVSLADYTIESADVDFKAAVDPEAAFKDQLSNPIFGQDYEQAELIFNTFRRIKERGAVCRSDIEPVSHLVESYPSLKRLMARYPLGSYTEELSRTNYEVSTEGFVRSVLIALKEAFFRVVKYLRESLTKVWDNLTSGRKRTLEVDKIGPRVMAMQRYVMEVDGLMVESPVADEWRKWQRRNLDTAGSNLSKNWNALKHEVLVAPELCKANVAVMVDTLVLRTVPMAMMIQDLMKDLTEATSGPDVGAAVAKAQMFDVATPALTTMVAHQGWRRGAVRTDPRLTTFKSMSGFMAGVLRSKSNSRQELKNEEFTALAASLTIDSWQELVPDLTSSRKLLESSLKKLQEFDVDKHLDPGLEQFYTVLVMPLIAQISVNVSALTELQAAASLFISTRDQAMLDVANSVLGVVKGMDAYISKNRDKLPTNIMVIVGRLKSNIANA